MKRIASTDLLFAVWLMALIVFGMSDSTSASELAAHGFAVILVIIAGEWLRSAGVTGGVAAVHVAGGFLLCVTSLTFHSDVLAVVPLTDLLVGSVTAAFGVVGVCEIAYEHVTGRQWLAL